MASVPDDYDFITCSVCLCQFDTDQRKPKFLQCFHTICLQCLQDICKNQNIVCPLCRARTLCSKGPNHLINNFHALHIVEMRKKQVPDGTITWCLTCAGSAEFGCLDAHNAVDIPSNKPEDGKHLQEAYVECKSKLTGTIRRLQETQKRLERLQRCIETINDGINDQLEGNDLQIAQLMSSLDDVERRTETLQLFRSKIDGALKKSDESLRPTGEETDRNIRIRVHLETPDNRKIATIPLLEQGFSAADCNCQPDRSEFLLLSHLVLSIVRKQNVPLKAADSEPTSKQSTSSSLCAHQ